jgi:hypothetical protein
MREKKVTAFGVAWFQLISYINQPLRNHSARCPLKVLVHEIRFQSDLRISPKHIMMLSIYAL